MARDTGNPPTDMGSDVDSGTTENDTGTDTVEDDPCGCNGGLWECGLGTLGCSCGDCLPTEECNANHQCEPTGPKPNGSYCAPTTACGAVPNFADADAVATFNTCNGYQCESGLCLPYNSSFMADVPVCSQPCVIRQDNNLDGVEDPGAGSDCLGFVDGPAGAEYHCVNFAPPGALEDLAYCIPGTTYGACDADADCPTGESCYLTSIGGQYSRRCLAGLRTSASAEPSDLGESCNHYDAFDPDGMGFCDGGLCYGLGCVMFCEQDSDCEVNGMDWSCPIEPRQIFTNLPELRYRMCWPDSCETEADCGDTSYCRLFWNGGETQETADWDNLCLPEYPGGVDTGDACDANPDDMIVGDMCAAETMCFGGYCSAVCNTDTDCAVDKDQLCVIEEIGFDMDNPEDGTYEFVLPLGICLSFPGNTGVECYSDAGCEDGQFCDFFQVENADPDNPLLVQGLCVPKPLGTGEWGEVCTTSADCSSGACLGASDDGLTSGICSKMCEHSTECESVDIDGDTVTGRCSSLFLNWGGALDNVLGYTYVSLCVPNNRDTSAEDCGDDFGCTEDDEVCVPNVITFGPDYASHVEYICYDNTNSDGSVPTKTFGQACDPEKEDVSGNPIVECLSGLCLYDVDDGTGYCSELCDPAAEACATDSGIPTMSCETYPLRERGGAYADNSAEVAWCMKAVECLPCLSSATCPGDRVCVNLGRDDGALADYRCVDSCTTAPDCTDSPASACNDGLDAYGRAVRGCFDQGASYPTNHCD